MVRPRGSLRTLITCTALVCALVGPSLHAAAQAASVTQVQASDAVVRFIGRAKAAKMSLVGLQSGPRGWIEGRCYKFTVRLGRRRLRPTWPLYDFNAGVLVQQETGRVVEYSTRQSEYEAATGFRKPVPKSRMIGEAKALSLASELLRKAGVSSAGLRAGQVRFWAHQLGERSKFSYVYDLSLRKHVTLLGIGEVGMPTDSFFEINAVTGELLFYGLLDQPVRVRVAPPAITKERAEEIVRGRKSGGHNSYGDFGAATSRLYVGSPLGAGSPQRFCWHVTIDYKPPRPWEPAVEGWVDAMTGELVSEAVPAGK